MLSLNAASVADAGGNTGPAADVVSPAVTVDRTPPTVTLYGPVPWGFTNLTAFHIRVALSEYATGLTLADLSASGTAGCVLGALTQPLPWSEYTLSVSGCSDGDLMVRLRAGSLVDRAGNPGPSTAAIALVQIDATPPAATIGAPTWDWASQALRYELTLSEPVGDLYFEPSFYAASGTSTSAGRRPAARCRHLPAPGPRTAWPSITARRAR